MIYWHYLAIALYLLPVTSYGFTIKQRLGHWSNKQSLYFYLNPGSEKAQPPSPPGLAELNRRVIRHHEYKTRYLEREELEVLYIQYVMRHHPEDSGVVLLGKKIGALVWIDTEDGRAKEVSTFFGRNVVLLKTAAIKSNLIIGITKDDFSNPSSRAPASIKDSISNAATFAEDLYNQRYGPEPGDYYYDE